MRQAKNNSIMHKIQLKWTKKSFNKVAKQQIFIQKKTLGLRLFYLLTMKKWIFRTKTTYLKILKAKDQLQASHPQPAMIHHLAIFNNWSMQGSSFKQIKIHKLNSQKIQKTAHKFVYGDNWPWKTVSSHFHMPVWPMPVESYSPCFC